METPQLKFTKEQDSTSRLFRQLFNLNNQLEDWSETNSHFESETKDLIRAIDELMESILRNED